MAGVKRSRGTEDCSLWYGPKFMGLWKRYEAAAAWVDIHRQAVHAARVAESNVRDEANCNGNEEDVASTSVGEVIYEAGDFDSWNLSTEEENHDVDEEEEETEMDEELAAFLRQTAEHRKQRDAERLEKENKKGGYWMEINGEDYILADKIGVEGACHRTTATPNVAVEERAKREQREKLYGKGAMKIAAMETAMQVQYEQYVARTDAQMWPIIPLKI